MVSVVNPNVVCSSPSSERLIEASSHSGRGACVAILRRRRKDRELANGERLLTILCAYDVNGLLLPLRLILKLQYVPYKQVITTFFKFSYGFHVSGFVQVVKAFWKKNY
jgi:hypothetical protein